MNYLKPSVLNDKNMLPFTIPTPTVFTIFLLLHCAFAIAKSSRHVVPITITETDTKPTLDVKKLAIMLLFKIGVMKLKTFAVLKVFFFLLLKFKLALTVMFIKFLLFLKAMKLLKELLSLFLLPMLSPLLLVLLPLLFLPFLLPLLLPLLLLLPIPVPAAVRNQDSQVVILDYLKRAEVNGISEIVNNLLGSEKCVERIACQLATKREVKILLPLLDWYLNSLSSFVTNRKMLSYINTLLALAKDYNGTFRDNDGRKWCTKKFSCIHSELKNTRSH